MAIPTTGPITLDMLRAEFGGVRPNRISEYYRGGLYVQNLIRNQNVPVSGRISLSNFRGATVYRTVAYDIIGGGGGGGFGVEDGSGTGRAASGGATSVGSFSVAGGLGGANGAISYTTPSAGQSSAYGTGGAGGQVNAAGGNATGFGAGGGGGGGDERNNRYGRDGNGGEGGYAGTRFTGLFYIPPGSVLPIVIGAGGAGATGAATAGGSGSNGFCRLTINGVIVDITSTRNYTFT